MCLLFTVRTDFSIKVMLQNRFSCIIWREKGDRCRRKTPLLHDPCKFRLILKGDYFVIIKHHLRERQNNRAVRCSAFILKSLHITCRRDYEISSSQKIITPKNTGKKYYYEKQKNGLQYSEEWEGKSNSSEKHGKKISEKLSLFNNYSSCASVHVH